MANTLLTISAITLETLRVLKNELTFTMNVARKYDNKFAVAGAKIGNTIDIRKPNRFTVRTGRVVQLQDITETSVPLTLDTQLGVDIMYTSAELALSIDEFSDRILRPQVAAVANEVDRLGLAQYYKINNIVGTPGTIPNALSTYLDAGSFLDEEAAPRDGQRVIEIGPRQNAAIVDALKGLFNAQTKIGEQYRKGMIGSETIGFDWFMDQNIPTHTVGPLGGTPLVNGASQTGANLVTDGWTAAAANRLNRGDVFTVAGVFAVNPQSRQSTGQLRRFVVTATTASDGSGNATIPIYPSIVTSGPNQTVSGSPADNAALTVVGAANTISPQGLAFHKDAFALGCADLPLPRGTHEAARVADDDVGLSIRMISDYDVMNDAFITRLDLLLGWAVLYPELAVRIAS